MSQAGEINASPLPVKTWEYIPHLFADNDPVALFLINSKTGDAEQKVHPASRLRDPDFQKFLRFKNANGYNVHMSMNPVRASYAVKLNVPNSVLEDVTSCFSSDASLAGYKQKSEKDEETTNLLWAVHAGTIPEAKQLAETLQAQILREASVKIPDSTALSIQVYQQHHRLKEDIREVRRFYLDLDHDGPENLKALFADVDAGKIPTPNFVITTSPDKYQVVWSIEPGLEQEKAEAHLRTLSREYGGDPACCDVSRVLRLPGLHNKKYEAYTPVKGECWTTRTHKISDFAYIDELATKHSAEDVQYAQDPSSRPRPKGSQQTKWGDPGSDTDSHRHWHYCCQQAERTIYTSREKDVEKNLAATYQTLHQWLRQNASEKHTRPDRYADKTIECLQLHIAPKIPAILQKRRHDTGLDEADSKARQILNSQVRSYSANPQSGLYIGVFIGETTRHHLQRLTPQTVIAHKKESFTQNNLPDPKIGRTYTLRYTNGTLHAVERRSRTYETKER